MNKITYILITVPEYPTPKDVWDLVSNTPNSKVINFYTMDMEDLSIVAKYRILPRPTLLAMNNTKVVGRFVGPKMPKASAISKFLGG